MIERKEVVLQGEKYTFAALTFNQLQAHEADLAVVAAGQMDVRSMQALSNLMAVSMAKMHPGTTPEAAGDLVTYATMADVVQAIMGVSGLNQPAGEPKPGSA